MKAKQEHIPAVQWITAVAGLLVVTGTFALLAREAIAGDDTPPAIVLTHDDAVRVTGGYLVRVQVRNTGGETAADLRITGELADGAAAESSEFTLDYLPPGSVRHAGLLFTRDPASGRLTLRATGYTSP